MIRTFSPPLFDIISARHRPRNGSFGVNKVQTLGWAHVRLPVLEGDKGQALEYRRPSINYNS